MTRKKIDHEAFRAAHNEGFTRDELAKRFNITPGSVTRIRHRLGLPIPPRHRIPIDREELRTLSENGWTAQRLADHFGCHHDTISRIRRELGISHHSTNRPMTEERLHNIWQMLYDGWSHKEIHETEGADVDTIRRHFPGTAWTFKQAGEHQAALRLLNPRHFNHHPKTYDRTKYRTAA